VPENPVRRRETTEVTKTPESVFSGSGVLCRSGKGLLSREEYRFISALLFRPAVLSVPFLAALCGFREEFRKL
jgi:hypothetical protein